MNRIEFKRRPVNQVYSCDITGDNSGVYVLASEYDAMKSRAEDAEQKLELANRAMIETNKRSVAESLSEPMEGGTLSEHDKQLIKDIGWDKFWS